MNLRARFERFCFRNRDKGIPNLMLYITVGSAIVYLMMLFNGGTALYDLLRFDKSKILDGQVWRLFTYVFTEMSASGSMFTLIFLYFFYMLGRHIEVSMGTFKFNLFYVSGMILMAVFAMIFCPTQPVQYGNTIYAPQAFTNDVYSRMAFYLHLSMLLMFATTNPQSQFLILFIIPIKAWVMGLIYIVMIAAEIFNLSYPTAFFPHNLFPLVGLLNYLIFAGKDVLNLFPFVERRQRYSTPKRKKSTGTIPYRQASQQPKQANYSHRCTICGRTDVTNPELEFRYCSRCNGYFCYCEDHISNHTHIE